MGKRELIIACGFLVAAVIAYQLTAPPLKEGERRFSLTRIFSGLRKEMRANSASATSKNAGTVALKPATREIRMTASRSVNLTVIGEQRDDVGYEMTVQSSGPDQATARGFAASGKVVAKDFGVAEKLEVALSKESGQQAAQVTLRVPSRLLAGFEGAGRVTVSDVRGVDLRNLAGDVVISNITDTVAGTHRSNEITVTRAGGVTLTLSSSRGKFGEIQGAITINARNGECAIAKPRGPVDLMLANVEATVTEPAASVRVAGEGGKVRIAMPAKDLLVDARRMLVEATLGWSAAATLITTDEALRVTLVGPPGLTIDASTTGVGVIRAADFGLEPVRQDRESRLNAPIGGGGARVVLRNSGADIVIALRK